MTTIIIKEEVGTFKEDSQQYLLIGEKNKEDNFIKANCSNIFMLDALDFLIDHLKGSVDMRAYLNDKLKEIK